MDKRDLLDQLVYFYYNHDLFQENKLSEEEARKYHQCLLDKDRIVVYVENDELLGYIESWRVNYQQLGWILCQNRFSPVDQDVNSGNICYLANITIRPDKRYTRVMEILRDLYFQQNFMCDFFCGESRRKIHQPFTIFRRNEFIQKYLREGVVSCG